MKSNQIVLLLTAMENIIVKKENKSYRIDIIYEDNHLLIVNKPVNLLSQGDLTKDPDLLSILKDYLKKKYNKPGNVYLGLVHRLDRPVGGVMVFARTSKAASRLSDQIRRNIFQKQYLAVIQGNSCEKKAILTHYLLKDRNKNIVKKVSSNTDGAKKAVLDYEILNENKGLSLVKISLHTGRSHQIRVQFAAIGYPIFGDQKYGRKFNQPGQQLALWAKEIEFIHPVKKEEVMFKSKMPNTFPWNNFKRK